jgi:uncharacterized protein (DUF2236 family)
MSAVNTGHDGLFGPGSVTWRVNRETVLLAGGGRALLLQVAHPLVAAGVAQHSNYQQDPWGRLYRTLDLTTRITFGDADASAAASRGLRAAHRRVRGTAEDGTPYEAADPDLLLWVWATLVDSSLLVYTRYVRWLSPGDVERYYQEQKRFAHACGVPEGHCPDDHAAFADYYRHMVEEELQVTDGARAVAQATLRPHLPLALRPAAWGPFELLGLVTVGLLPPRLRSQYGLSWGPRREALLTASTIAVRRTLPLLPGLLREFPPARAAAARAAA